MHCHVREGSIDSKVPIEEFIKKLQSKGIGGMLVTDHDTYNGYRHWKNTIKGRKYKDFVVLKGIEYDTLDAGHILIIMPQGVKMRLLELRGLPDQDFHLCLFRFILTLIGHGLSGIHRDLPQLCVQYIAFRCFSLFDVIGTLRQIFCLPISFLVRPDYADCLGCPTFTDGILCPFQ